MSNTKEPLEVSNLEEKQNNNEKKETIIDIDEIPITDVLANEYNNSDKIIAQHIKENDKNYNKEVINSLAHEPQDNVVFKVNELNKQDKDVELANKQRKPPDVWIQFQETKRNIQSGKDDRVEGLSEQEGKSYQQGGGSPAGGGFDYDPESRNGFILLVFTILLVMLALTVLYCVFVLNSESMTEFYDNYRRPMLFISSGVIITMSYVMMCCLPCVRTPPCNFIVLFIVLAAMSNLVAVFTTALKTEIVIFALIGTSVTVGVCIMLALSRFDFTAWYLYLIGIMTVVMILSLMLMVGSLAMDINFKPLHIALLYISTILQVCLLIMELQMVIGGKSIEINEEDYALAAYLLYTSMVNLFLQILQILANFDE